MVENIVNFVNLDVKRLIVATKKALRDGKTKTKSVTPKKPSVKK